MQLYYNKEIYNKCIDEIRKNKIKYLNLKIKNIDLQTIKELQEKFYNLETL